MSDPFHETETAPPRPSAESERAAEVVEKVRSLLRKAESTEFVEEAEALTAKAQELIARYSIAQDKLSDVGSEDGAVSHEDLRLVGPYSYERALLWGAVANANRCRLLRHKMFGTRKTDTISLIGRPSDRELTKLLAVSLEQQALRRLPASTVASDGDNRQGSLVRQRRSFLLGFAGEVSRRLTEANETVASQAGVSSRNISRIDELDLYVRSMGEVVADRSRTQLDADAYTDGTAAAGSADLGQARIDDRRGELPA